MLNENIANSKLPIAASMVNISFVFVADCPLLCLGWEIGDTTCQVQVRELG